MHHRKKYLYGENGFPIDKPMARSYLEKASEKVTKKQKIYLHVN